MKSCFVTNAGMNQFKPYFLSTVKPPYPLAGKPIRKSAFAPGGGTMITHWMTSAARRHLFPF